MVVDDVVADVDVDDDDVVVMIMIISIINYDYCYHHAASFCDILKTGTLREIHGSQHTVLKDWSFGLGLKPRDDVINKLAAQVTCDV